MSRSAILSIVVICLAMSCVQVRKSHQVDPLPNGIPRLNIVNDTTAVALKISALDIKTVVAGNIATTLFDIRFYNPNNRILEGELEFPLADGQHITRYALDINGALREAVVVEKAKARVAFETIVRRGIDPGLVEKTKGNNFRTRIYPLPAKGYRRILIEVEQTLEQNANKDLVYQLPLHEKNPIDSFSIEMKVLKTSVEPEILEDGTPVIDFKKQKDSYVSSYQQNNFIADQTIAFILKAFGEDGDIVLTENHNGQTYFYVNSRIEPQYKARKNPATIGLFWDVSASGEKRDLDKELGLLKKYLSALNNVSVSLIPFNIYTQPKEDFIIRGGNSSELIERLRKFEYDGGTQLGTLDLTYYNFEESILFSDGLSTFGKQDMIFSNFPVITVTSSPSANYSYLKHIALQTRGKFIDLSKQEPDELIKGLEAQPLQIVNIIYDAGEIEDVVIQSTTILYTGLSFAGKLKTVTAGIKVQLGFGSEVFTTKEYTISKEEDDDYDQIKRIWATMKITNLDMEYEKNREEITKLGKEFSVVTQNTSLLVLDRVEDYVEHEIEPPVELQKEYYSLLKGKRNSEHVAKELALNQALDEMKALKEWWKTDFSKIVATQEPKASQFTPPTTVDEAATRPTAIISDLIAAGGGDSLRVADSLTVSQWTDSTRRLNFGSGDAGSDNYQLLESSAYGLSVTPGVGALSSFNNTDVLMDGRAEITMEPQIQLKQWKPDATYLRTLEQTSARERFSKYLALKKDYNDQPSFFVDVARFFIEKSEKKMGVVVLSNICEMKLEDAGLLRIVANQLLDAGEKDLAIETFDQILKMREEDPQSYRDLALAYNETGEYSKAVELLYKLVTGIWDGRFGEVKGIALNEMNAIISARKASVNIAGIDKRLVYEMPVDVRIVIGWNADNSDIDLWVTDPTKELCSYQHTRTAMGGRISRDVTQGFGPEEFLLKKAKNGNYIVDVNLYGDHRQTLGGPIAIKADLFTDFGKPTQKRRTINFRVTTNKEVINLGSLKFGS
jgi:tetratricopeptide (TPR) repeat protein